MSDDDFKTVADSGVLHPFVTLREIDEVLGRTTAKPKPQFILHVDLMRIGMPRRQAEYVRRLKVLVEEFDIEWEPMAPKREQELLRLLEDDEQQRAA
jgi:hypothetical protein